MTRIERIVDDINNDRTLPSNSLYFEKGFAFLPMVFSENFNEDLDWSLSVSPEPWLMLWFQYRFEVMQNGQRYTLKPTKGERKAVAKAYEAWYKRQKEYHQRNAQDARK